MKIRMLRKLTLLSLAATAVVALIGGHTPIAAHAHAWSGNPFRARSAAKQLPKGFVLPSADLDLKVSSLVAADLDADGDLDIVAANGSLGILVWVNDGAGRLTRQDPAPPRTLGSEPAAPWLEGHQTAGGAPVQPDGPAIEMACERARLMVPARNCERPRAPDVTSAAIATLRSRSPPALS